MDFLSDKNFSSLFPNELETIRQLIEFGALHKRTSCSHCTAEMQLYMTEQKQVFRCPRFACGRRELSCRAGSIFKGSKLQTLQIMRLARCWLLGMSHGITVQATGMSSRAVRTWYAAFREIISIDMKNNKEKIGGLGMIVEIDETLLGRRKNNRGHHVEGVWTIIGIERGPERRGFGVVVEHRDATTIRKVIQDNVCIGSTLYTDEWRGYIGISEACNVEHKTVKHKDGFKDMETGVCTNTVEGLNRAVKHSIPARFRNNQYAPQFIDQFFWKRRNKNTLCESFIQVLADSLVANH